MRTLLLSLLLGFHCLLNATTLPFKIAVVDENSALDSTAFYKETATELANILNREISLKKITPDQLEDALDFNQFEAYILPSLLARRYPSIGLQPVASLTHERASHPNLSSGITLFVNTDKSSIRDFTDLNGKRIGLLKDAPTSALIFQQLSQRQKLTPQLLKEENSWEELLNALYEGKFDAIALPSCLIEYRGDQLVSFDTAWLSPLGRKANPSLSCAHSSDLFPGYLFALSPFLPPEDLYIVGKSLLGQPPGKQREKWRIATDFRTSDELLRELNLDEHASERILTLKKIISNYWPWCLAFVLLMFFLALHSVLVSWLVKRRTNELQQALLEQKALKEQATEAYGRLEKLQKLSALGQMSSLFAHELRQPLNQGLRIKK